MNRFTRRGRLIIVDGVRWRYRVGWYSTICYSETGKRILGCHRKMLGQAIKEQNDDEGFRYTTPILPSNVATLIRTSNS